MDVRKIHNYLELLQQEMKKSNNPKKLMELLYNYEVLAYIYYCLTKDKKYKIYCHVDNTHEYQKFSTLFMKDSLEAIINHRELLRNLLFRGDKFLKDYCANPKINKALQKEYYQIVQNFFQFYDPSHQELFASLLNGSVEIIKGSQILEDANGKCFYLSYFQDSLIFVKKPQKSICALPHEVAHAFELRKISDFTDFLNWHYSSFVESYPKFIELLFIQYLKEFYNYDLTNILIRKLVNFKYSCEYFLEFIKNVQDYDLSKNELLTKENDSLNKISFDKISSDLLAYFMFYLYNQDLEKFREFMDKYWRVLGKSDAAIWNLVKEDDFVKSLEFIPKQIYLIRNR